MFRPFNALDAKDVSRMLQGSFKNVSRRFKVVYGKFRGWSPWRIGTLKYSEMEIKKCPSGAMRGKWGQIGPNGTKRDQTKGKLFPNILFGNNVNKLGLNWAKLSSNWNWGLI